MDAELDRKINLLLEDNKNLIALVKSIVDKNKELPEQPKFTTKTFRMTNEVQLDRDVNTWLKGICALEIVRDVTMADTERGGIVRTITVRATNEDEFDE